MSAPGTPHDSPRIINRGNVVDPSILLIASKDRIKHVLKKIDPEQRLDADVEDILMDLTWDFINSVSNSATKLTENNRVRLHGSEDGTGKLVPVDEFEEGYTILEADGVHQMAKGDYESKPLEPLEP